MANEVDPYRSTKTEQAKEKLGEEVRAWIKKGGMKRREEEERRDEKKEQMEGHSKFSVGDPVVVKPADKRCMSCWSDDLRRMWPEMDVGAMA